MAEPTGKTAAGVGKTLLIAIVVSAIIGAGAGFSAGYLAAPAPIHHAA